MIHVKKNKITFSSNSGNVESNDIFAKFKNNNWSNTMKPITTNATNNSSLLQTIQKTEPKTNPQQISSNIEYDAFVKKDKNNIAKKVAIGTSLALVAYSAFALIKYHRSNLNVFEKLTEPIKVLMARINPNGFKPSVTIEENDMKYLGEVSTHLRRLNNVHKKENYIKHLFETTNFTEESKNKFIRWYSEYLR